MKVGTQKITPFLWFDGLAEEAMKFYGPGGLHEGHGGEGH